MKKKKLNLKGEKKKAAAMGTCLADGEKENRFLANRSFGTKRGGARVIPKELQHETSKGATTVNDGNKV